MPNKHDEDWGERKGESWKALISPRIASPYLTGYVLPNKQGRQILTASAPWHSHFLQKTIIRKYSQRSNTC